MASNELLPLKLQSIQLWIHNHNNNQIAFDTLMCHIWTYRSGQDFHCSTTNSLCLLQKVLDKRGNMLFSIFVSLFKSVYLLMMIALKNWNTQFNCNISIFMLGQIRFIGILERKMYFQSLLWKGLPWNDKNNKLKTFFIVSS